jgi:hypothetical protein
LPRKVTLLNLGNHKIKFKLGMTTMYKSGFDLKAFDENILTFVQDKVDHLWQNYPTDYQSTYLRFFQDRNNSDLRALEMRQELKRPSCRLFSGNQLSSQTQYQVRTYKQNSFVDFSRVKQNLKNFKNPDMIPSQTGAKFHKSTEYRDTINNFRAGSASVRTTRPDFK